VYDNIYASKINPDERVNRRLRYAFNVETNDDLLNCSIPRNPNTSLPDIALIPDPIQFIRAMIIDTSRLINIEADGADDSIYDYVPDGIDQLQYLYSCIETDLSRFNAFMNAYLRRRNDDRPDDIGNDLGADFADLYFQDCTSPLLQYIA
jgi:hypothetical protein